jgi:GPH family glycoside/pentoside/hexuronide:cation symporter
MWLWGSGTVADALMIQTFGLIMPIFNTGFGLDAVLLSWALMLPRLVDGLFDPILGHLSDNTKTRWGRRKPFLVVSTVLGSLLITGIWWADPNWPAWVQFVYISVLATMYYCTWGTYSMTHSALGFELTDDYHERSRVAAIRTVYLQMVVLIVSWTYWLALRPIFGGEIHGIRFITAVMAVLILISGMIPVLVCQERFATLNRTHVPMLRALKEALRLGAFRTYLAMRFFWALGLVLFTSISWYVNVYYVCRGDKQLATKITGMATAIVVVGSVAILPLVPRISRRIGKRSSIIAGASLALLQACAMPLLLTPEMPYLQLLAALLFGPLVAIAIVMRDAIVPDICDLDELAHGQRREALFSAVISFVYKIEVSVCVLIVGYLVSFSGFDPKHIAQPAEVLTKLQWFAHVPNILCALMATILAIRFPVTEKLMQEVRQTLDLRHLGMAAARSRPADADSVHPSPSAGHAAAVPLTAAAERQPV